jgi:hydrogenase maturation protease
MQSMTMMGDASPRRTLVLGLGNPILSDDAVGLAVARRLKAELDGDPWVEVDEDFNGGLRLMERLAGYDRAVIIDAILSGAAPGTVHLLSAGGMPTQRTVCAHDVSLPTALAMGRRGGLPLPETAEIHVIAIEAADVMTFGEELTPAVAAAVPLAVQAARQALQGDAHA